MADRDFDRLTEGEDAGKPTAAHVWEEQFLPLRNAGLTGPPPREKLLERIDQLDAARVAWPDDRAAKGWAREAAWRRKQYDQLALKEEAGDGDPERQE